MKTPDRSWFLDRTPGRRLRVFFSDYLNFITFLLFVLINITVGRGLKQWDRLWKTAYLGKLIAFFEKMA